MEASAPGPADAVIVHAQADTSTNSRRPLEIRCLREWNMRPKTEMPGSLGRGQGPHGCVPGRKGSYSLGLLEFTQQV